MIHAALEILEPEDFVGNLWHDWASRLAAPEQDIPGAAVTLEEMRTSVTVLFRALGGACGVEIGPAPATVASQRRRLKEQVAGVWPKEYRATFDGEHLRLPPEMTLFPTRDLNRAAYLWTAALAAVTEPGDRPEDPLLADMTQLRAMEEATRKLRDLCPGLLPTASLLAADLREGRAANPGSATEAAVEELAIWVLGGPPPFHDRAQELLREFDAGTLAAPRGYVPLAAVPIWPRVERAATGRSAALDAEDPGKGPQGPAVPGRKRAERKDQDQANRRDTFILHRFEGILSWAESLNIARMSDDDDAENAAKAAEDQDRITLSQHWKRAASRLRVSLDLAPQDALHERLSDRFTYPEWNHRSRSYMPDHARVLEAEAETSAATQPDPRLAARVRRQFEALHPRRVTLPRQMDGTDLDLDSVVNSQAMIRATGQGSDRIHLASRATERDLAVALLVDCSRSTEAVTGDRSVIDTARDSVAALASGLDKVGDRLAIWGFCSLRRDRVFLHRCKSFGEPMSQAVTARIGGLRPGHYTRLGAAIRHAWAQLAKEGAQKRLLLVLTDGKPNDLDHYEGVHGIEDSRMAVREARALGQSVHGVVIDADGQDWFARIFGRGGFTLLPDPQRLPKALPDIYHGLTRES